MSGKTLPGEVWRVDFGMAAKVRPALVLSDWPADNELALLVVVPVLYSYLVRGHAGPAGTAGDPPRAKVPDSPG